MSDLDEWATRVPGMPFRWVLNLASEERAPVCPMHDELTDELGVCEECLAVAGWSGARCSGCGFPLHPAVVSDGFDLHPSCDLEGVSR